MLPDHVLIETYWNVKIFSDIDARKSTDVLIETYWNVKECMRSDFRLCKFRINRNILECKVFFGQPFFYPVNVLIETYWNVKP